MNEYQLINMNFLATYKLKNIASFTIDDIIFSLTTIPSRFIHPQFEKTLDSLYNQLYKSKYIIVHLCDKYNRNFIYDKNNLELKINYFKEKYDNIIFNFSEDFGPITKILGTYSMKDIININDKIIVVDDDMLYKNTLTYYYELVYQLYTCDCIFIDDKEILSEDSSTTSNKNTCNIFYDNYKNMVYGWGSFSIKYKFIEKLYDFYKKIIVEDNKIINHDDLILTLFYKLNNLYACGINLFLAEYCTCDSITNIDSLSSMEIKDPFRNQLEKNLFKKYNIDYKNRILSSHECNISINETILPRNLLHNILNISYLPNKNNFFFKHIDLKYFDNEIFILTCTFFNDELINNKEEFFIFLEVDNIEFKINLITESKSCKQTYFIKLKKDIFKIESITYNFNIIQTFKENNININKFYSINTILSYIPELKYEFFSNERIVTYLKDKNEKLILYFDKLLAGAYKADFFRAIYLYYEGGIYFDCKNILYTPIYFILLKKRSFCEDLVDNIYNGNLFLSKPFDLNLKNYILHMLKNIKNEYYGSSPLDITGPSLLKKYISEDKYLKNIYSNNEWKNDWNNFIKSNKWKDSYIIDILTNQIIIKTSYYNYYDDKSRNNYNDLYYNKNIFSSIIITNEINENNL